MKALKQFLTVIFALLAMNITFAQQEQIYSFSVTAKNTDSIAARADADQQLMTKAATNIYSDIVSKHLFSSEEFSSEANKERMLNIIAAEVKPDISEVKWNGKKCSIKAYVSTDIYQLAKKAEAKFNEPAPAQEGNGAAAITLVNTDGSEVTTGNEEPEEPKNQLTEAQMMAAQAYLKKAMEAQAMKNYDVAIENYQLAVEIDATSAEPFFKMGNAFYELNRFDDAITAYEKALAINPEYGDVLFNLGNSYLEKQNYQTAIEAYERVLSLDNANGDAYYYLGVALFQNGDQNGAIYAFQNAARNGSRDAQIWLKANNLNW